KEGRANLKSLSLPLPRRGVRTCKEISYNSLRNYTLCIVHYELKQSHITPVLWLSKPQHPVDYNKKLSYLHNNSTTIKP
ncbi:MAG: hypothetical protein ACFN4W_05805, partial [Segatella oris]